MTCKKKQTGPGKIADHSQAIFTTLSAISMQGAVMGIGHKNSEFESADVLKKALMVFDATFILISQPAYLKSFPSIGG
jgi:hypothetical protein